MSKHNLFLRMDYSDRTKRNLREIAAYKARKETAPDHILNRKQTVVLSLYYPSNLPNADIGEHVATWPEHWDVAEEGMALCKAAAKRFQKRAECTFIDATKDFDASPRQKDVNQQNAAAETADEDPEAEENAEE